MTDTMNHTWEQMNAEILKRMEEQGYTHYKARAECFADVISAFHIIHEYNRDKEGHHIIRLISPTIKGSPMGDTDFDFWTESPIKTIQILWDTNGRDLHRIIQTIKPFDKYDGKTDLSFWDKPKPKDEGINNFEFNITNEFADILAEMEEDQKALLDKPSGLTQVLLCSNYWDKKYRQVDFTGTTNEEAIKKILTFYKHKTHRRLVGDHTFFEGIDGEDNKISLGS